MRSELMVLPWLLGGCVASRQLTQGVALWPFVLGTEVEDASLEALRGTEIVACLVDVDELYEIQTAPIVGATVLVDGPGLSDVVLVEVDDGVYQLPPQWSITPYKADASYTVTAIVDANTYTASAPAASALQIDSGWGSGDAAGPLEIQFPNDYKDEYDQVLARVSDTDNETTWSTWPATADEWLSFASTRNTPRTIEVPKGAFADGGAYGVIVIGAVRARESAVFSDNLRSQLSGFTTGAGYAYLLEVGL